MRIVTQESRESVYVGEDGHERIVVVAKAPTWRDIWAILRGRYEVALTVDRSFDAADIGVSLDTQHFLWAPDAPRRKDKEKVGDYFLGLKPHVSDEKKAEYRKEHGDVEAKLLSESVTVEERNGALFLDNPNAE